MDGQLLDVAPGLGSPPSYGPPKSCFLQIHRSYPHEPSRALTGITI